MGNVGTCIRHLVNNAGVSHSGLLAMTSDEDAVQKFQFDLYYVKNYSLFLDLLVLVQTVRVVLWPVGVR